MSESTQDPGPLSKLRPRLMNRSVMSLLHSVIATPTTMANVVPENNSMGDGAHAASTNTSDKDERVKVQVSGRTSPASSVGLIKCPMYCRSNCVIKHHPLLVAILNCVDTAHMELMEMKLGILYNVINKYKQSQVWSVNDPIPDVLDDYKYPMLHWVCTLGRVGAAIWLIGHNISDPTTKSTRHNGETALHRALLCLQETCPVEPSRKFVQLLSVLEPALALPDNNGNTPLHVCCEMLRIGLPRIDYYKECLHYMMYELSNEDKNTKQQAASVLNMKNLDGDTLLHLLAESDKHISEIKPLVLIGANYTTENNAGLTAYEVALKHDCLGICRFFETWQGTVSEPKSLVLQGLIKPETKLTPETEQISEDSNPPGKSTEQSATSSPSSPKHSDSPSSQVVNHSHSDSGLAHPDSKEITSESGQVTITKCDEDMTEQPPDKKPRLEDEVTTDVTSSENSTTDMWSMENFSVESTKQLMETAAISSQQLKQVPVLFPDDLDVQHYFKQTVDEHITNPNNKAKSLTATQFVELMANFDESDTELHQDLNEAVKQMNPSLLTKCLVSINAAGSNCQTIIDFILKTRNENLTQLKMAGRCVTSLQQIFREEQTKQDDHVANIMTIFENLSSLNKEERKLTKELDELDEHSAAAKTTNGNIRERIANCDAALKVLKCLYIDATANSYK